MNDNLPRESLSQEIDTQHQLAGEDQITCVDPGVDAFDLEGMLQLQDLPSFEDGDHPMICENLGPESPHSLRLESGNLWLACTIYL